MRPPQRRAVPSVHPLLMLPGAPAYRYGGPLFSSFRDVERAGRLDQGPRLLFDYANVGPTDSPAAERDTNGGGESCRRRTGRNAEPFDAATNASPPLRHHDPRRLPNRLSVQPAQKCTARP